MERNAILCIDDEPNVLNALHRLLQRDYKVSVAESVEKAFEILRDKEIDLVICDQRMPKMTGIEVLKKVKQEHPDTMRFLLTAYADLEVAIAAINEGGVHRFITKPWNNEELKLVIRDAFAQYWLRMENRLLTDKIASHYRELLKRNQQLQEQNDVITALNQGLQKAKAELEKRIQDINTLLFEAERRASKINLRP